MGQTFTPDAFHGAPIRANELKYIANCLRQGHCCAIVGPSNTGKSHLIRSLPRQEVRERSANAEGDLPVMVHIDCLEAGGSEQAFYELLLRRTIEELEFTGVSAETIDRLRELHKDVLTNITDVAFRSIYGSSVRQVAQTEDVTVVLILDEFYDVFQHLPPWPFRQLRALYDAPNTKVCYVTATSHHLEQLRPGSNTYEFRELFHLHTLVLKPLVWADAQQFVEYLAGKQNVSISAENIDLIVELSGGHPGILERICLLLSQTGDDLTVPLTTTITELLNERPLIKECRRLWSELELEQEALLILIEKDETELSPHQNELLEGKGLTGVTKDGRLTIFSPVFKAFIEQEMIHKSEVVTKGLHCDFETGQIWINDEEITLQLSEPQRKLIAFLYEKVGTICTYDQIAQGVWGVGEGVSPGAIYELVKRVRQKIEPDWKNPQYIVTISGKGYRLQAM